MNIVEIETLLERSTVHTFLRDISRNRSLCKNHVLRNRSIVVSQK